MLVAPRAQPRMAFLKAWKFRSRGVRYVAARLRLNSPPIPCSSKHINDLGPHVTPRLFLRSQIIKIQTKALRDLVCLVADHGLFVDLLAVVLVVTVPPPALALPGGYGIAPWLEKTDNPVEISAVEGFVKARFNMAHPNAGLQQSVASSPPVSSP